MAIIETMRKEILETRSVARYNPKEPAKLGNDLFLLNRYQWNLGIYEYRLFLMLAQQANKLGEVNHKDQTKIQFRTKDVIKGLGLEERKDKYNILYQTIDNFTRELIRFRDDEKEQYMSFSLCWLAAREKDKTVFCLTPIAVPLMVEFTKYSMVRPANAEKLNTTYQQAIYSLLRSRIMAETKKGKANYKISDLLQYLGLQDYTTYTTSRNAKMDFCKKILGIKKPKGWEYDWAEPEKAKPWDYMGTKKKPSGTLWKISTNTDIEVKAYCFWEDGENWIHFDITEIDEKDAGKNKPATITTEKVKEAEQSQQPGESQEQPKEDEFDIYIRIVSSKKYDTLKIPLYVLNDDTNILSMWQWYLTAPKAQIKKEVLPRIKAMFAKIENGTRIQDCNQGAKDIKAMADAGQIQLMPWERWDAIRNLYQLEKYEDIKVNISEIVDYVRKSTSTNKWLNLSRVCQIVKAGTMPINNHTAFIKARING